MILQGPLDCLEQGLNYRLKVVCILCDKKVTEKMHLQWTTKTLVFSPYLIFCAIQKINRRPFF